MPFVIHANLDCEARWAGGALPGAIAARVSYYAALLSVLAPADAAEVEVWAPAAIDASRLAAAPWWRPPTMKVGTPPRADLAWAPSDAKAANDRRLALQLGRELGVALPGAEVVESVEALVAWCRDRGHWVAKAPWTTAGRDRCHGAGAPTGEQRTRLSRLVAKFGALVVEPWVARMFDVGVCARIAESGIEIDEPHGLVTDPRGTFLGIDLAPPALTVVERATLVATARAVSDRLATLGFRGAFAIDAFAYRDAQGERAFHPLCEINARQTFGAVARAFARHGLTRLGFGAAPPLATVLIAPADDGVTAWIG